MITAITTKSITVTRGRGNSIDTCATAAETAVPTSYQPREAVRDAVLQSLMSDGTYFRCIGGKRSKQRMCLHESSLQRYC